MLFSKSRYDTESSDLIEFSAIAVMLLLALMFGLSKSISMNVEIEPVLIDPPIIVEPLVTKEVPRSRPEYMIPLPMDPVEEDDPGTDGIEFISEPYIPTEAPLLTFNGNVEIPEEEVIAFINVQDPPKLNISEKDKLLRLITENYPSLAKKSGSEGKVKLSFVCSKEGYPTNITVAHESPEGLGFGEAAVSALKLVRFSPGYQNDKPVAVRMSQTIGFVLKK
jgi:periplasmic protein TonB